MPSLRPSALLGAERRVSAAFCLGYLLATTAVDTYGVHNNECVLICLDLTVALTTNECHRLSTLTFADVIMHYC